MTFSFTTSAALLRPRTPRLHLGQNLYELAFNIIKVIFRETESFLGGFNGLVVRQKYLFFIFFHPCLAAQKVLTQENTRINEEMVFCYQNCPDLL